MRLPDIFHALLPAPVHQPNELSPSSANHKRDNKLRIVELFVALYMINLQTALTASRWADVT
jgi:hypothetical protein